VVPEWIVENTGASFTHIPFQQRFASMSLEIVGNTPAEFAKFIAEDRARGERLVKTSGARLD
jgi:tripartite-type tricarboxylate transporter receptor subunit TctC